MIRGYLISSKIARDLYVNQEVPISTGSIKLDDLLNGGLKPYYTYLFYGEAGTGKTTILKSIVKNSIHRHKKVMIISYKPDIYEKINQDSLRNSNDLIAYYRPESLAELKNIIEKYSETTFNFRIISIDDLNLYNSIRKQDVELSTFLILKNLIYKWGASLVLLTGVSQIPGLTARYIPKIYRDWIPGINYIIFLNKIKNTVIRATDIHRNRSIFFKITSRGVEDI